MKKLITTLILVTFLLASFSMLFSVPNVKAQVADVTVVSTSWYISSRRSSGDLIAVGEIQNTGTQTLDNITVVGIAYDNNSQQLAQSNSIVYGNDIAPQQKAPFYLDFFPINGQDQSWETSVSNVTVFPGLQLFTQLNRSMQA